MITLTTPIAIELRIAFEDADAGLLEDLRRVVDDGVDPDALLEHGEPDPDDERGPGAGLQELPVLPGLQGWH